MNDGNCCPICGGYVVVGSFDMICQKCGANMDDMDDYLDAERYINDNERAE